MAPDIRQRRTRRIRAVVGGIEILAGLSVLVGSVLAIGMASLHREVDAIPNYALLFLAGLVSARAGIQLIRNHPDGWKLSIIVQAVQLPVILLGLGQYSIFLLLRVTIGIAGNSLTFSADGGGEIVVHLGQGALNQGSVSLVGVNVLALACLMLLWMCKQRSVDENSV